MKRLITLPATVILFCLLVPCHVQALSKEEGIRLFNEAKSLQEKAQTNTELEQAVQTYQQALAIFERLGFNEGIARTAGNLGTVYSHWGQYDKALEYYDKILEIFIKIGDIENVGKTLGNMGAVYYHWGQNAKAVEFYEKDLAICRKIGDSKGERAILMNLGNVHRAWGRYTQAVGFYEKALETARKIGDAQGEGDILNNWGNVYSDWGQYAKAVEFYEKALDVRRKIRDIKGEGGTLNNLGIVYKDRGQYARAVEFYGKALEILRKIGDVKSEGASLGNLGTVYIDWGQYARAAEFYENALEIFRKIGDVKSEGTSLMGLGNVYRASGQYVKAVEFYENALEIFRKIGDVKSEGLTLTNLGEVYRNRGEHDRALATFQKGLEVYVKIGVPANRPKDLIGNLYLDKGEERKAEPFIKEANYHSSLGRLYLVKADYLSAKASYENLLKSSEQNRDADDLFTAYAGLGMSYEGMGDNPQAVEYYRKAVMHTEILRSSLNPAERQTFFDVKIGGLFRIAPYEGLARVLAKMNRPVEALKESEYTRARIFAESISKRSEDAGLDVPKNTRDEDSQLTDELAALTKNLQKAYEKQNKEQIAVLEPQEKEAKQKLSLHVDMLRKQYPLFAATRYPQPMDLDKTALQDNEWVLAYHVTDSGIIIYLTKSKSLVKGLFKPIPRMDIDGLVRKFRQPMEIGPDDSVVKKLGAFDFAVGRKLADVLLGDILSDLPRDASLIIIPDGSLGVVPFEMLVLNDNGKIVTDKQIPYVSGAEFFGDRNPISYYQSITALTLARTLGKQQKRGEKLLVMVDPVFSADDPRLANVVRQERDKVLGAPSTVLLMSIQSESGLTFPRLPLTSQLGEFLKKADASNTDLYEGLTAKKSVLLGKDLTHYRSVIFATHGYFGKDLPGIQEPVLVLSLVGEPKGQDGFLRLSEVMGLKINCDIAALTACQAGLGRDVSGEGTMGMGRAFQYAGAKSVLMSLWSVSETASVSLVERFFSHLKGGKNKLESLKLARDEIRNAGYNHPFFWAPFILVGEVE